MYLKLQNYEVVDMRPDVVGASMTDSATRFTTELTKRKALDILSSETQLATLMPYKYSLGKSTVRDQIAKNDMPQSNLSVRQLLC